MNNGLPTSFVVIVSDIPYSSTTPTDPVLTAFPVHTVCTLSGIRLATHHYTNDKLWVAIAQARQTVHNKIQDQHPSNRRTSHNELQIISAVKNRKQLLGLALLSRISERC